MAFTRAFLKEHGVPEEEIDAIMAERNRTLADYVPKSDVQAQINEAMKDYIPKATMADYISKADAAKQVDDVKKGITPVTESEEYKKLLTDYNMTKEINGDEYSSIKPKFRETVYRMLDHGEKAKPIAEQLKSVQEKYDEYFVPANNQSGPVFGSKDTGGMPSGSGGDSFSKAWGYVKKEG